MSTRTVVGAASICFAVVLFFLAFFDWQDGPLAENHQADVPSHELEARAYGGAITAADGEAVNPVTKIRAPEPFPASSIETGPQARTAKVIPHVNSGRWGELLGRSRAGDAEATYTIAKLLQPNGKAWPELPGFDDFKNLPADRFYWLRLAASQGSSSAMVDFANTYINPYDASFRDAQDAKVRRQFTEEAIGLINRAIAAGSVEALVFGSNLLIKNNSPFVSYDAVGSVSCLLRAGLIQPNNDEIKNLITLRSAAVSPYEKAEALRRMTSPNACQITLRG